MSSNGGVKRHEPRLRGSLLSVPCPVLRTSNTSTGGTAGQAAPPLGTALYHRSYRAYAEQLCVYEVTTVTEIVTHNDM